MNGLTDCQREGHQWFHSQICGAWFCLRCGEPKETQRRAIDGTVYYSFMEESE